MKQRMNREWIKYLAIVAMTGNHFAYQFLPAGTLLCEIVTDIGYLTAPVMCYFLAEGYQYTRSKKQYLIRLLLFAAIAQLPYSLYFEIKDPNMLATLSICFLTLLVREKIADPELQGPLLAGLILLSAFCDWPVIAPVATILYAKDMGEKEKLMRDHAIITGLFFLLQFIGNAVYGGSFSYLSFLRALGGCAGVLLGGILLFFCYDGTRAERFRTFHKWFFYLYYPLHLGALYLLKIKFLP